MSNELPRVWEIWHARFNYENAKGYKYRPVIVVGVGHDGSLVMMVTGVGNKLHLKHDYVIRDWKEAGLHKPSIARADRIAEIPFGYVGSAGRIGRLSKHDEAELRKVLEEMLKKHE